VIVGQGAVCAMEDKRGDFSLYVCDGG
jgi:hypothetical protein